LTVSLDTFLYFEIPQSGSMEVTEEALLLTDTW